MEWKRVDSRLIEVRADRRIRRGTDSLTQRRTSWRETMATGTGEHRHPPFVEDVAIAGHIIDSLILPKVLDEIAGLGGRHHILDIRVGERRQDPSFARLSVEADSRERLEKILASITRHGAV